jgi:hypothetical protein
MPDDVSSVVMIMITKIAVWYCAACGQENLYDDDVRHVVTDETATVVACEPG